MLHLSSRNQTLILFYLQIKSDSFVWEWKEFGTSKIGSYLLLIKIPENRFHPLDHKKSANSYQGWTVNEQ